MPDSEWTFQNALQIAFVALATWALLRTLWEVFDALESRKWPTTPGVIVTSRVSEEPDLDGGSLVRAKVTYRYTVAGHEIVGKRICFAGPISPNWGWHARRTAARYKAPGAVSVFYNPDKPSEAVLEPGVRGPLLTVLIVQIVFLAMVIWSLD